MATISTASPSRARIVRGESKSAADIQGNPGVQPGNVDPTVAAASGYRARGFALAAQMKALVVSHADALRRCIVTALDYEPKARDAAIAEFRQWSKDLKDPTSGAAAHLKASAGYDDKQIIKLANSATVRASEFSTVLKALNIGMTRETMVERLKVSDPENLGFHIWVKEARDFLAAHASKGNGRTPDAFTVKLAKFLKREAGTSAEEVAKAVAVLKKAHLVDKATLDA
jgi:hypothetical protein